ncbi:unnamed protein product [Natator depressus]
MVASGPCSPQMSCSPPKAESPVKKSNNQADPAPKNNETGPKMRFLKKINWWVVHCLLNAPCTPHCMYDKYSMHKTSQGWGATLVHALWKKEQQYKKQTTRSLIQNPCCW